MYMYISIYMYCIIYTYQYICHIFIYIYIYIYVYILTCKRGQGDPTAMQFADIQRTLESGIYICIYVCMI